METLSVKLREYIKARQAIDPAWQKFTIVYSGHEVPGEGEHKIMSYIREIKRHPDYNSSMRHCIYGRDSGPVEEFALFNLP